MTSPSDRYLSVNKTYQKVILGIDPGTNVVGYGVIGIVEQNIELIDLGHWTIKSSQPHFQKLRQISEEISLVISHYKPHEMAIEAPFFGKNVQSMLKLGRAQGVAIATAMLKGLEIFEYSPKSVKQSVTGNGNASKEQVAAMLSHILKIPVINEKLDATDALGVAICHHFQFKTPKQGKTYNSWNSFLVANPDRVNS
jgi:crossover junction endodeoxyribonuclease RuvC